MEINQITENFALVKSINNVEIGDIIMKTKGLSMYDDGIRIGELVINVNPRFNTSNEFWQAMELYELSDSEVSANDKFIVKPYDHTDQYIHPNCSYQILTCSHLHDDYIHCKENSILFDQSDVIKIVKTYSDFTEQDRLNFIQLHNNKLI
jgi:hypothetical protein